MVLIALHAYRLSEAKNVTVITFNRTDHFLNKGHLPLHAQHCLHQHGAVHQADAGVGGVAVDTCVFPLLSCVTFAAGTSIASVHTQPAPRPNLNIMPVSIDMESLTGFGDVFNSSPPGRRCIYPRAMPWANRLQAFSLPHTLVVLLSQGDALGWQPAGLQPANNGDGKLMATTAH